MTALSHFRRFPNRWALASFEYRVRSDDAGVAEVVRIHGRKASAAFAWQPPGKVRPPLRARRGQSNIAEQDVRPSMVPDLGGRGLLELWVICCLPRSRSSHIHRLLAGARARCCSVSFRRPQNPRSIRAGSGCPYRSNYSHCNCQLIRPRCWFSASDRQCVNAWLCDFVQWAMLAGIQRTRPALSGAIVATNVPLFFLIEDLWIGKLPSITGAILVSAMACVISARAVAQAK
jgi:hypothetical protein